MAESHAVAVLPNL